MLLYCNGQLLDAATPLFDAANRSFRYGDGLFETIKVYRGEALLWPLHLQRLHKGMHTLGIHCPPAFSDILLQQVQQLCIHNHCTGAARVRIAIYRKNDDQAGWVVEAAPLSADAFAWNEQGWQVALYPDVRKAVDILANHKTANYLLYTMAARAAQQQGVDECLVLNAAGLVCDGSRTNVFVVTNDQVVTPALSEGCVAGVMRSHLLQYCADNNIPCREGQVSRQDLLAADEIFLTNAIQGIRWVQSFGGKTFGNVFSRGLYTGALATIYR